MDKSKENTKHADTAITNSVEMAFIQRKSVTHFFSPKMR